MLACLCVFNTRTSLGPRLLVSDPLNHCLNKIQVNCAIKILALPRLRLAPTRSHSPGRGGCPFHTRHKLTRIKVARLRTSILPHRYVLSSDYTLSHPGYFASNLRYSATTKFRSRNRHTGRGQPATRLDGTRLTHGRRRRTRYTITSSFSLFAAATRRCESLGGNSGGGGFAGSGTLTRESTRGIDAAADRWAPLPRP